MATNLLTMMNPNGQNQGQGITGSPARPSSSRAAAAWAGTTVQRQYLCTAGTAAVRFPYSTDADGDGAGIKIDNGRRHGQPLVVADTERLDLGWTFAASRRDRA